MRSSDFRRPMPRVRFAAQKYGCPSCLVPHERSNHLLAFPGGHLLEALGQPRLDDGLSCHTEATRLSIKGLDDPGREIDVDSLPFLQRSARLGEI